MIDIFISYSRKDQEYVEWIKPVLKRLNLEKEIGYYQDIDNIIPGEDFKDSIDDSISTATVIICFLSNHFFASSFIHKHELPLIERSYNNGLKVMPILVEDVLITADSFFCQIQRANLLDQTLQQVKKDNNQASFITFFEKVLRSEFEKFPLKPSKKEKIRYNIVVVGKAGVGKSELINYLFGQNIVKAGIGRPITVMGFQQVDLNVSGIPASIFDSAGLEVGNHSKWISALENELSERGPTNDVDKWFHTILYCIQAPGLRIEPFELEVIDKFLKSNYKVIVVITKSYIKKAQIEELTQSIKSDRSNLLKIIHINSKEEEFGETVVRQFGKSELSKEIQMSLIQSLTNRIPARCIGFMAKYIDDRCNEQIQYINNAVSFGDRNLIADNVKIALQTISLDIKSPNGHFSKIIANETKTTLSVYKEISGAINQLPLFNNKAIMPVPNQDVELPQVKSIRDKIEDYMSDAYDWDFTEKYGELVDFTSKILAFPFLAIIGVVEIVGEHLDEIKGWRIATIKKVNEFRDSIKKELVKKEEHIKKVYLESLRDL